MNEKNLEDKVCEAAKTGKNRFGLCDACVHRMDLYVNSAHGETCDTSRKL